MCRRSFIVRIRLRPRYSIVPLSMYESSYTCTQQQERILASIQCTHFTHPSLDVRQEKEKKEKGVCKQGIFLIISNTPQTPTPLIHLIISTLP
jgi:hypothetical protein